ncbi:type I restriction-modification system specificity subunit domain-containing protein [Fructobacillus pseudoficulneus]|uniref:Type I restriction-modification system specificity subunit domain-containing protein n=1 Tax=Fructobacillus pseudoficulneus TaxID=220714 RepID=A0A3F3GZH0_9LACO|nr:restriction endonuclease subunit S [Fructobacillus pseudoficulneus]GAP03367.1 type I restriction-modification system specificity subunit domain-containing protein [Fructobacillus pseudoficulneus]SEH43730.1 type I restriction enzyme, S subunit [Fructobacillus pseudoficulneus]
MDERTPVIRFKGFTDDWEQRKLGEVSSSFSGGTPSASKKEYYGGNIPFIRSAEINSDSTQLFITQSGLDNSSAKLVKFGDILYAMYGATSGEVGISRINGAINQAILSIRVKGNYSSLFLHQWLKSNKDKIIDKYLQGGQGNLSGSIVKNLEILFPKKDEQEKIGNLFRGLDNLITLHQRKLRLLQEQKKGLLQKMFPKTGDVKPKLRFSNFTDDWEQRKVGELFTVTRGQVLAVSEVSSIKTLVNPYPVYSSQTKNNGLLGYYHDYLFDGGITWTTDGANAGTVKYRNGRFYSTNVNGVLLSNDGYINKSIAEILNKSAWKYVSHVGNPKLMNNVMSDIKIKIPTKISEQEKLSVWIDKLDNLITLHQRKLKLLQEQKKGLLQKMFV